MAAVQPPRPVLRLVAAFSRYPQALDWARERLAAAWGQIALESQRFDHRETSYYEASMGPDLLKTFFALAPLADPADLAAWKIESNDWEIEYQQLAAHPEPRPLNLDPGYLTEAKLVLATTKDRDHRLYLSKGIYAENTLYFYRGSWTGRPWTYPDYLRPDYHAFFLTCRDYLRQQLARDSAQ